MGGTVVETTKILLSPSETELAKELGEDAITSVVPEQRGADIVIFSKNAGFFFQRKGVPGDFISSIEDGRMARATSLLSKQAGFNRLILEGKFKYWPDGKLFISRKVRSRWSEAQIIGILFDIEFVKGIPLTWTSDIEDTARYLRRLVVWAERSTHTGLYTRPSVKGAWGVPTIEDVQLWLLQGFQGVGVQTASSIVEHFGRVPLSWSCTFNELCEVKGLSHKRAEKMWETLPGKVMPSGSEDIASNLNTLRGKLRGKNG